MLMQIVLYVSNSFSLSIRKDINLMFLSPTLNVSTYPIILGITKTNGLISLSKYPVKYLELDFKTFLVLFLSLQISTLL